MAKDKIKQIEDRINELEKTIISHTRKRGDIANQALEYSKKTINWFLIIVGIASAFFAFIGFKTFYDVSIMAEEAVNKAISTKEEKWEERFSELEKDLSGNIRPSSYSLYERINYWGNPYRNSGLEEQPREYQKLIDTANKILKSYPNDDLAIYTKAYSYAALGDTEEALTYLAIAIEMDTYWKERAINDMDFEKMCKLEEFKKLVGGECEF